MTLMTDDWSKISEYKQTSSFMEDPHALFVDVLFKSDVLSNTIVHSTGSKTSSEPFFFMSWYETFFFQIAISRDGILFFFLPASLIYENQRTKGEVSSTVFTLFKSNYIIVHKSLIIGVPATQKRILFFIWLVVKYGYQFGMLLQ